MVQVRESVGAAMNGSMNAVSGSGMASMSLASMLFQPRMEEPSKPKPSVKTSAVSSLTGTVKCCQVPKVSTNFTSTILAPDFFASSITLLDVAIYLLDLSLFVDCRFNSTDMNLLFPVSGFCHQSALRLVIFERPPCAIEFFKDLSAILQRASW